MIWFQHSWIDDRSTTGRTVPSSRSLNKAVLWSLISSASVLWLQSWGKYLKSWWDLKCCKSSSVQLTSCFEFLNVWRRFQWMSFMKQSVFFYWLTTTTYWFSRQTCDFHWVLWGSANDLMVLSGHLWTLSSVSQFFSMDKPLAWSSIKGFQEQTFYDLGLSALEKRRICLVREWELNWQSLCHSQLQLLTSSTAERIHPW